MKKAPLGKKRLTGDLIFEPIERKELGIGVHEDYEKTKESTKGFDDTLKTFATTRGVIEHQPGIDIGDPLQMGWTYLIHEDEPLFGDIIETIRPLAEHRGMNRPDKPLIFTSYTNDDYLTWMSKTLVRDPVTFKPAPHYIMIIGNPDLIPFKFQAALSTRSCVGRLDIDSKEDLKTYVDKVIRIENSQQPYVTDETIFFATDEGINKKGCSDPTFYSHHYLSKPLSKYVQNQIQFKTNEIMAEKATKKNLLDVLGRSKPSLIFTASHGTSPYGESADVQKKYTGAIVCQGYRESGDEDDSLITEDDIPIDRPFVEGSVFIQFGCFGYGTPAITEVANWNYENGKWDGLQLAKKNYISPIQKKLLFNPNGPLAFIGHVDVAMLNSFTDPKNPLPEAEYAPMIDPYFTMLNNLLRGDPVGLALSGISQKFGSANNQFVQLYNSHNLGLMEEDLYYEQLADTYLERVDAGNFMIGGDPAARMRIMQT